MSLVSDALRKARREATRKGISGQLPPTLRLSSPAGRGARFGAGLVLGATIAIAAGLAGAAAAWWLLAGSGGGQVAAGPTASLAPSPVVSPTLPPGPGRELREAQPSPLAPEVGEVAPAAPQAAAGTAESALLGPSPSTAGGTGVGARLERARAMADLPEGTPSAGHVRVFVLDAALGYASLSLDYLVYRSSDPFAQVNGQEVHVGSVVDGFVVEEITAGAVRLRDDRGSLELRVR